MITIMDTVYTRQEQEPASSEVTEVAPGVLRMQLPISLPGLGHVNCYALVDDDGVALVDPGLPGETSWTALGDRLKQAGIPLRRVHTAVVTHSHPDHFGGSHQLRDEVGAAVLAHSDFSFNSAAEAANADLDLELLDLEPEALIELWKAKLAEQGDTPWGTTRQPPSDAMIEKFIQTNQVGLPQRFRVPQPSIRVNDGESVRLAGRDWFAVHTPGHTHDHLCLWDPAEGVLLSGDHVLPTITPHIAGSNDLSDPLAAFFESLQRVGGFDGVKVCLPAHGHPFSDLRTRTDAIREHHCERLDKLRAAADALGDAPVEAYMQELFAQRSWGYMAASETFAHLEHLHKIGTLDSSRNSDGLLHYRPKPSQQLESSPAA